MTRKRGLGRGLNALLQEAEPAISALPVDRLRPNRLQPRSRFDEGGLAELADSIRAKGVVQPIVVTPGEDGSYSIVAGERRWRAARRAGLAEVPVLVRQVEDDQELLELALVENLQRADLDPIEEAEAYRMLRDDFSLSQEQIGARVGKSRPAVANSLRLLKLPEEVKEMLRGAVLTAGQARPLLGLPAGEQQIRLARKAAQDGLTARELERLAASPAAKPSARKKKSADAHTAAAEEELTRRLQTRVEIRRRGAGGELRIRFHSEEELMRLYDLLMRRGKAG